MMEPEAASHITWYRTPLDRATLNRLNSRSDVKGLLQSLGYLMVLVLTGAGVLISAARWPWWAAMLILFLHGTVASFLTNAMHELVHRSVFRTQWLNALFVRVFSFFGWLNFHYFWTSHVRHHQYTLHPPDDLEVVLPIRLMVWQFLSTGIINVKGGVDTVRNSVRLARGKFEGEWETRIFPAATLESRRPVVRWARGLLGGHTVIIAISLAMGWWLVPVVTSLLPFYGGWLFFLCNNTQHIGLKDNVPDFRLCCRTFTVNPVVRFLYWNMNYHTEHHMFAAVPCYSLGALHRAIVHDLPASPHGLRATWREIAAILEIQKTDPSYQHLLRLPLTS